MADKRIGELPIAPELYSDSLLVAEQQGEARSVRGEVLAGFASRALDDYVRGAGFLLKIGNTATGEAGSEVKVENAGTANRPVLDFTIPRGDPGVSPSVSVSRGERETNVTITDADGPHAFSIPDGKDGAVASFNGRAGVVLPEAGDYAVGDITGLDGALGKKADLVNGIVSDAQLGYATHDIVYYVDASGGSDEAGDGTEARPFASLPHALSLLPKNMNNHQYFIYLSEGVHRVGAGLVYVNNFIHGAGNGLCIYRDPRVDINTRPVIDAEIHILNNSSLVNLSDINVQYTGGEPKNQYVFVNGNTGGISISRMDITDDINTKLGTMQITSNGTVSLYTVSISGAATAAVYCGDNQRMNITNCRGSGNAVCYKVGNNAMARPDTLYLSGCSMEGTVEIQKLYNSIVFKNGVMV